MGGWDGLALITDPPGDVIHGRSPVYLAVVARWKPSKEQHDTGGAKNGIFFSSGTLIVVEYEKRARHFCVLIHQQVTRLAPPPPISC